jgi:mRNA interferase YafQ
MRTIVRRQRFSDDIKRMKRRGRNVEDIVAVVDLLVEIGELPDAYRPHLLKGEWAGLWECHIEPDWLLIYQITEREVILVRTGSHSDLFD